MYHFFVPTEKNNYRAFLLHKASLIVIAILILIFNSFARVTISAQSLSQNISIENLLLAHNREREKFQLEDLELNPKLNESAKLKAEAMLQSNCWSHYCPEGVSPWKFFDDATYDYVFAGENLAEGYFSIDDVINAWMNSKTHRENIMRGEYEEIGFGIAYGSFQGVSNNVIIVVHFGTQTASAIANSSSREVFISRPLSGQVIDSEETEVSGYSDANSVEIILNGETKGNANIGEEGIFTFRVSPLVQGSNEIYARIQDVNGIQKDSDKVVFTYQPSLISDTTLASTTLDSNLDFIQSVQFKNIVNLFFIGLLVVLFVIDFMVLSRTKVLSQERSYSHYHLGIFIVLGLLFLTGGFYGNLL